MERSGNGLHRRSIYPGRPLFLIMYKGREEAVWKLANLSKPWVVGGEKSLTTFANDFVYLVSLEFSVEYRAYGGI